MTGKPKPTKLKAMEGNPGKRSLPNDEVQPPSNMPSMPKHLCADAVEEWSRICSGLNHMGILTEVDRNALAAYCTAYALWAQSWRAINEMAASGKTGAGLMIKTTNGNFIQNPLVGTANKAASDMVRFASEFGLTPAARARIALTPKGEESGEKGIKGLLYGGKKE